MIEIYFSNVKDLFRLDFQLPQAVTITQDPKSGNIEFEGANVFRFEVNEENTANDLINLFK